MYCNRMIPLLIVLLSGCDSAGLGVHEVSSQDGVGPLRGLWEIVSYHENGEPDNEGGGVGMQYLFEDSRMVLIEAVRDQEAKQVYRCAVNEELRQIDWTVEADEDLHLLMKGIYLLEGDTLTICRALPDQERPTKIYTVPGDDLGLYVLKRVTQSARSTPDR